MLGRRTGPTIVKKSSTKVEGFFGFCPAGREVYAELRRDNFFNDDT
jgi:hypothetical protein